MKDVPDLPRQQDMVFDGETYEPHRDKVRLGKQAYRVFGCMVDGNWRTLRQISDQAQCPEASASARLRDFRKHRFGAHDVEHKRNDSGLWWYRLVPNDDVDMLH